MSIFNGFKLDDIIYVFGLLILAGFCFSYSLYTVIMIAITSTYTTGNIIVICVFTPIGMILTFISIFYAYLVRRNWNQRQTIKLFQT
jgi:hypothetical protein